MSASARVSRRESRERAFALLFEKSFHPETEMEDIISVSIESEVLENDEFATLLAQTAWDKLFAIDNLIEKYSRNWKKSRISRVALSVLRLSICEMLYITEIPIKVSINEAVELCKKYAAEEDASFVNGILGSVARNEADAARAEEEAPAAEETDGE